MPDVCRPRKKNDGGGISKQPDVQRKNGPDFIRRLLESDRPIRVRPRRNSCRYFRQKIMTAAIQCLGSALRAQKTGRTIGHAYVRAGIGLGTFACFRRG